MAIFGVHLSSEDATEAADRLASAYPDHLKLSDRFYLVRGDVLTQTVAETVGIRGATTATGVVFKLNAAYAGYDDSSVWEWLSLGEQPTR